MMEIDYSQFEKNNWDEFVHVRALMDLLEKVAESDIGEDNIKCSPIPEFSEGL